MSYNPLTGNNLGALALRGKERSPRLGSLIGRSRLSESRRAIYGDGSNSGEELTLDNVKVILVAIATRTGSLKRSLSSTSTSPRAYYVWRMARFHGGVDVTMPITASVLVHREPKEVREALDRLADDVAKDAFGTDLAGAARWGRALGYLR